MPSGGNVIVAAAQTVELRLPALPPVPIGPKLSTEPRTEISVCYSTALDYSVCSSAACRSHARSGETLRYCGETGGWCHRPSCTMLPGIEGSNITSSVSIPRWPRGCARITRDGGGWLNRGWILCSQSTSDPRRRTQSCSLPRSGRTSSLTRAGRCAPESGRQDDARDAVLRRSRAGDLRRLLRLRGAETAAGKCVVPGRVGVGAVFIQVSETEKHRDASRGQCCCRP